MLVELEITSLSSRARYCLPPLSLFLLCVAVVTGGGLEAFFGNWCLGCFLNSEMLSQYAVYDSGAVPVFIILSKVFKCSSCCNPEDVHYSNHTFSFKIVLILWVISRCNFGQYMFAI